MGDAPFNKQQTTSSQKSGPSTNPRHLEYATERAKLLFGSYRRTDAADPDIYVAAIARVLSAYDATMIRDVTDPVTGIAATEKYMSFMPNAGELKVYCDGVAARRERIEKLGSLPRPDFSRPTLMAPTPGPGDKANVFVPVENKHYQKLVDWSRSADPLLFRFGKSSDGRAGIWVAYEVWENRERATRPRERADDPRPLQLSPEAQKALREADENRGYSMTPPAEESAA